MLYIVEVPEAQLEDLRQAINSINPEAPEPMAIGMDENQHVATLDHAEGTYLFDLMELVENPAPWESLDEDARMAVAAYLSGFIDWQFEGGGRPDYRDTLEDLIREHPEIGHMREEATVSGATRTGILTEDQGALASNRKHPPRVQTGRVRRTPDEPTYQHPGQDDFKVSPDSGICLNPSFPRQRESTGPTFGFTPPSRTPR